MLIVIVVVLVVILVAAIVVALVKRQKPPSAVAAEPIQRSTIAATAPLTGLESALDQATDRQGRTLRDKVSETAIDDLRVVDDSGPILRRALDHAEQPRQNTHVDHGRIDADDLPPVTSDE